MIIVGDKEINIKSGSLRKRTGENIGVLTIDEIQNIILEDSSQNHNT